MLQCLLKMNNLLLHIRNFEHLNKYYEQTNFANHVTHFGKLSMQIMVVSG